MFQLIAQSSELPHMAQHIEGLPSDSCNARNKDETAEVASLPNSMRKDAKTSFQRLGWPGTGSFEGVASPNPLLPMQVL